VPTHRVARLGIGLVPEDRRIFADLTVTENLAVGVRPEGGFTIERVFGLFPKLADRAHQRGGSLSGGEQQMLTIARTLMTGPRLLLLDEPSEGLAPVIVQTLADTIAALKHEGLTIVMAEQNLKFARRLADRAYIIETAGSASTGRWGRSTPIPPCAAPTFRSERRVIGRAVSRV